jgi:hypothetical protein
VRFKDLNESDGIRSFADQAEGTLKGIGALAKRAFDKFATAHDAKAAAIVAAKKAATAKAKPKTGPVKTVPDGHGKQVLPTELVSFLVLDRTPDENDLPEIETLGPEEFNAVQQAVDKVQSRFEKFSKALPSAIADSGLIQANEKSEIADRLGDQNNRIVDSAETMLMADKYHEQAAWNSALDNDDAAIGGRALVKLLSTVSDAHVRLNLGLMSQKNKTKSYAEGLNLVNMLGGQRQVIELRISLLKAALAKMVNKPVQPGITTEQLRRLGELSKLL